MSLEITGRLVFKGPTEQVSEKFKKREFVVEITDVVNGQSYANFGKFHLVQNKCDIIDRFREGDQVTVKFNIKGNRWERDGKVNYITNLDAWRVEPAQQQQQGYQQPPQQNYSQQQQPGYGQHQGYATGPQQQYASQSQNNPNSQYGNYNYGATPAPPIDDLPF